MGSRDGASPSILLVEDERIVALATQRALESAGYIVHTARTGNEAIDAITSEIALDLVLMDIDLGPEMDGVAAAAAMLEQRTIPIVFVTSHTEHTTVERVASITRYGYVDKQSGHPVLLEAIARALQLSKAERELREHRQWLATITEQADDGIAVYESGSITYATDRYAQLLGYENSNELAVTTSDIIERMHPGDRERVVALYRKAREHKSESIRYRYRARRRDGSYVSVEDVARIIHDPDGGELRVIVTSRRISDIEELSYRSLFDAAPNPISIYDREARLVDLNRSALNALGMTREQIYMKPLEEIVPGMQEETKRRIARCIDEGDRSQYVDQITLANGSVRWFSSTFERVELRGHAEPVAQVISFDITKKKTDQFARAEHEKLTNVMMRAAPLMVYIYDVVERRNVWVNDSYQRFLEEIDPDSGVPLSRGAILELLHPDDRHVITDRDARRLNGDAPPEESLEFRVGRGNDWRWMVNRSAPFEYAEDGSIRKIIGFLFDITEQKQAQEELKEALQKNELLMQEMNHRVKNNLLMVRSLIHLTEAEKAVDLSDLAHQVTSISLVHELLHASNTTESINVRSYIDRVLESIFSPIGSSQVEVENRIADAAFPPKTVGVIGLIINESATNALKHAFRDPGTHRFSVELKHEAGAWRLTIENTGRPFPDDVSLEEPHSLGLRLITMLISQLNGTVALERTPHTRFIIRFAE